MNHDLKKSASKYSHQETVQPKLGNNRRKLRRFKMLNDITEGRKTRRQKTRTVQKVNRKGKILEIRTPAT